MSEDRGWREVPEDAPSLEEVVGHDAVARARQKVREVMELYEEIGLRHADQDSEEASSE
jgi:hypothetical protein